MDNYEITLSNDQINDPAAMDAFSDLMAEAHAEMNREIKRIAEELDIDEFVATNVLYLRTRSRWTPELEERLIMEHKSGLNPNMCSWPPNPDDPIEYQKDAYYESET